MNCSFELPSPQSDNTAETHPQLGAGALARLVEEIRELRLKNLELAAALELSRRRLALFAEYEAAVEESLAKLAATDLLWQTESPCHTAHDPATCGARAVSVEGIEAALARERNRIAQDIHDGLAQQLTGIVLELEACHRSMRSDPARAEAQLVKATKTARATLADIRNYMFGLRAPSPGQVGLVPSLERLVVDFEQRNALPARLKVFGAVRQLTLEAEESLLRVAQEALTNVSKHAQAKQVEVSLRFGPAAVELCVLDDGNGFNAKATIARAPREAKLGIVGMQERLAALGGSLVIESAPGAGTRLTAQLPLDGQAAQSGRDAIGA